MMNSCLTDELDWSLNLNDFELSLIRDFVSDGSSPDDEPLSAVSVTNVDSSDTTVLPQHKSTSPENSANLPAIDATLPAVTDAIDVDFATRQCNEVVSGGKDRRSPTLEKEAFTPSFPGRTYRGVRPQPGGKFAAEIKVRNPGKKCYENLWLGTYNTAEEAAMAYDRAAFKYHGSGAVLNLTSLIRTNYDIPANISLRKGRRSHRVLQSSRTTT